DGERKPGGLGPSEAPILAVDVVHQLGERHEPRVVQPHAADEHLEGALIALVTELGLVHVEANFAFPGLVRLGGDEAEGGVSVDEPADEPRTRHAVPLDARPGHPGHASKRASFWRLWCWQPPRLDALEPPPRFQHLAAVEEVDLDDLLESAPHPL